MIEICDSAAVPEGEIVRHEINGVGKVAVARHEGEIFVFPDTCPHAEESLSTQGWIEDGRIVCGVHFAEFELGSGEVHNRPVGCPNLSFFRCEDRNGKVFAVLGENG